MDAKAGARARFEHVREQLVALSHRIHARPEVAFEEEHAATACAEVLARQIDGPGWSAKRYPGRVWRPQEVAVFLDRRPLERQLTHLELAIVRCDRGASEHDPGCYLRHRGLRWW